MRELVREDGLDLLRLEPAPQARRHGDDCVLRIAPRRERVRDVGVDDRDARLGQVGHRAQALDHRVQLGRLLTVDDLGAGCSERDLVGGVVLEDRDPDHDHEHRCEPDVQHVEEDEREPDIQQAEQPAREQHPQREAEIASVIPALHGSFSSLERVTISVVRAPGPRERAG